MSFTEVRVAAAEGVILIRRYLQIIHPSSTVSQHKILTYVLTIFFRIIKNLVLPHIQIEYHDQKNDPIIEPFARDLQFHGIEADNVLVKARQIDVQSVGKVRKVPILHDDQ